MPHWPLTRSQICSQYLLCTFSNQIHECADLDGNNFWDETEVKALFVRELDKVYQSGMPEDDMRERIEEMERMREHVFREADTNHDNLISFEEFIAQTKREEFNRDPNWETVDNQPQFTHQEYLEFERRRQEEIQRLIAQGVVSNLSSDCLTIDQFKINI